MRRILTVAFSALMLAGCASEPARYDKAALPDARAAARQAEAVCEKQQAPAKFSASAYMACRVAAERGFALALHLPNMDAFDTYAARMQALAADYDAGRIALKQMGEKAAYIRRGYWRACDCNPSGRGSGCDWNPFVQSTDLTPPGVQVASSP